MTLQTSLTESKLILEVLKELHCLTETTPELQEERRQQIIRDFRIRMVNFLLEKLKRVNREHEYYKDKY
jgi:hypothetical protein